WVLPFMVTEGFLAARQFIVWVTLGYVLRGIYQVFFPFLVHMRRTHFLAISTSLSALLNLLLNYLLIHAFGALGAAYATVASFALSAPLVFWYQQRHFPMPWIWSRS